LGCRASKDRHSEATMGSSHLDGRFRTAKREDSEE
jgi:hypothetical protein